MAVSCASAFALQPEEEEMGSGRRVVIALAAQAHCTAMVLEPGAPLRRREGLRLPGAFVVPRKTAHTGDPGWAPAVGTGLMSPRFGHDGGGRHGVIPGTVLKARSGCEKGELAAANLS